MKKLILRDGITVTLVDGDTYEWASKYTWTLCSRGYVVRYNKYGPQFLHREIINATKHTIVDHKDRDRLNNVRDNLRFATLSQNQMNKAKQKNNTSGYKGVNWDKNAKSWRVEIQIDNKKKTVGRFKCKVCAAKAYNNKAKELFKEFAVLNDISDSERTHCCSQQLKK